MSCPFSYAQAVLADPLRESLPEHSARLHTPARLPPLLNVSMRQAAAKLFTVSNSIELYSGTAVD